MNLYFENLVMDVGAWVGVGLGQCMKIGYTFG